MAWQQTHSGRKIDISYPYDLIRNINIEDIAHSLANQCRFNGHTKEFYSVAQHSVIVANLCEPENALAGLLHDAVEAYTGDIIAPLKHNGYLTSDFIRDEMNVKNAIYEKFNIDKTKIDYYDIRRCDLIALKTEKRDLMAVDLDWYEMPELNDLQEMEKEIVPLMPVEAERLFLWLFENLI